MPNTAIDPHTRPLGSLLSEGGLSVPRYQRAHSWKRPQVQQLFADLWSAYAEGANEYFLGAMVVNQADGSKQIVDGQQRLATFSILLAAIRDLPEAAAPLKEFIQRHLSRQDIDGRHTPTLVLGAADEERFRRSITAPPSDSEHDAPGEMPRSASANVYARTSQWRTVDGYRTVAVELELALSREQDRAASGRELAKFLLERVYVIYITVPSDDLAYTVFETLNERGLGLSVSDLLKNHLLSHAGENLTDMERRWNNVERSLDPEVIPKFLRHQYMADHGKISTKALYRTLKGLFLRRQVSELKVCDS